jgi:hypothetical protein
MTGGGKFGEPAFDLDLFFQPAGFFGAGKETAGGKRLGCRIGNGKNGRAGKDLIITFSVSGDFRGDRLSRFVEAFEVSLCVRLPVEGP